MEERGISIRWIIEGIFHLWVLFALSKWNIDVANRIHAEQLNGSLFFGNKIAKNNLELSYSMKDHYWFLTYNILCCRIPQILKGSFAFQTNIDLDLFKIPSNLSMWLLPRCVNRYCCWSGFCLFDSISFIRRLLLCYFAR